MKKRALRGAAAGVHLIQVIVSVAAELFLFGVSSHEPPAGFYIWRYAGYFLVSAALLAVFGWLLCRLGGRAWVVPAALAGAGVLGIIVRLVCGVLPDSGAVRAAEISGRVFLRLAACPLAALNVAVGNAAAIFLSVGVWGVLAVVVRRSDRFGNK